MSRWKVTLYYRRGEGDAFRGSQKRESMNYREALRWAVEASLYCDMVEIHTDKEGRHGDPYSHFFVSPVDKKSEDYRYVTSLIEKEEKQWTK